MHQLKDQQFGRLFVESYQGNQKWRCRCDCGRVKDVFSKSLRRGDTKSCGCLHREIVTKHGRRRAKTHDPTYGSWCSMHDRCNGVKPDFKRNYTDRGIRVCRRWSGEDGFANFLADMGDRPPGTTLDRCNNDKGYSSSNCRWATKKQQARNTRRNRVFEIDGQRKTLIEWCEIYEIWHEMVRKRLRIGWPILKALGEQKRTARAVLNGVHMSVKEACKLQGLVYGTVRQRLRNGWDMNLALTTPPDPRFARKKAP